MNIHKLQYADEETAMNDFISKGVYIEVDSQLVYGEGIQAVPKIGKIVEFPAEYDEEGNVIVEPIYYDGIFYDIMCIQEIDFGANRIYPVKSVHSFLGYDQNADGPV